MLRLVLILGLFTMAPFAIGCNDSAMAAPRVAAERVAREELVAPTSAATKVSVFRTTKRQRTAPNWSLLASQMKPPRNSALSPASASSASNVAPAAPAELVAAVALAAREELVAAVALAAREELVAVVAAAAPSVTKVRVLTLRWQWSARPRSHLHRKRSS